MAPSKRTLLGVAAASAVALSLSASTASAQTITPFSQHMICMIDTGTSGSAIPAVSWPNAQDALEVANHLDLVTIDDAIENAQVRDLVIETYQASGQPVPEYVWTGFYDGRIEGVFTWASGRPVLYTNWAEGNPSSTSNGFSAAALSTATGKWIDVPADAQYPYVFRVPPSHPMYHSLTYDNGNLQDNCRLLDPNYVPASR